MEEGWTFIRIEWKDLFNEAEFKYRVLRALNRGGSRNSERHFDGSVPP
jgi:hypothetical protein